MDFTQSPQTAPHTLHLSPVGRGRERSSPVEGEQTHRQTCAPSPQPSPQGEMEPAVYAATDVAAPVQYAALYFAIAAFSSFMIASGSPPAFFTLSPHALSSGSAAFFHSASCSLLIV